MVRPRDGRWSVAVAVAVVAIPVAPPSTFLPTPWPSSSPVLSPLHVPFPLPTALTVLFPLRYASRAIGGQGRSMWTKPEQGVLLWTWRGDGGAYVAGDECRENEVVDRH